MFPNIRHRSYARPMYDSEDALSEDLGFVEEDVQGGGAVCERVDGRSRTVRIPAHDGRAGTSWRARRRAAGGIVIVGLVLGNVGC